MRIKVKDETLLRDILYEIRSKWNSFTYPVRRRYYRLQLFKRFCKTPYYGCWELCDVMLDYPFQILNEFYENYEDIIKYRWNIDEAEEYEKQLLIEHNKDNEEIEWLYNWYNFEKPKREEELQYLLDVWSGHHVSWWNTSTDREGFMEYFKCPNNKYADYLHNLMSQEEVKFEQEKEDALIRLVKIRRKLWD